MVPKCLTIAGSDSVALTAQNTTGVTAVHEVPPAFVRAQLEAVFDDLGVDAVKTGMLFSIAVIETVADFLAEHPVPLVVDPVMVSSSGARLLELDAAATLVKRLFPLATVVTPNLAEAQALVGDGPKRDLAVRLHELGAPAVIVTGGHGEPVDYLFDGERHVEIPVERVESGATHGAGCTHSATLAALLARGLPLEDAARGAAEAASRAVAQGLAEIGAGDGPVDVLGLRGAA
jgi:hydroxymethylpyrimidine/phosphomethylpyrimidine kinase